MGLGESKRRPQSIPVGTHAIITELEVDEDITLPAGLELDMVEIAGPDVRSEFRNAKKYNEEAQMPESETSRWIKAAGSIEIAGKIIDVHVVYHPDLGVVENKIKSVKNKKKE